MTATATRSTGPTQPAKLTPLSELVSSKGNSLPNRCALHALEGWGKSSFGAYSRKPIFIQSKGETGLETLIDAGRIPETPHFPECQSFEEVKSYIRRLINDPHSFGTLVLDTINGIERLCHEVVCETHYKGDRSLFIAYGNGPDAAAYGEWRLFLSLLDELRIKRKMTILCLAHTKVQNFKNPEGSDFERYQPDLHKSTWSITHQWTDVVLFGNFETDLDIDKATKKAKGKGGDHRILCTTRTAAFDAKNRLGLRSEIDMGHNAQEAWANFMQAVKDAKAEGLALVPLAPDPTPVATVATEVAQ